MSEDSMVKKHGILIKIVNGLNKVSENTGKILVTIAGIIVTAMMFLTAVDVSLRYIFNHPITGTWEITEFMMSAMVACGLGYCAIRKGHIRVDLVLTHLSQGANKALDIFAYGISAILFIFMSWQVVLNGQALMENKLTSAVLFIPVYPFVFIVVIGIALLALVFIKDLLNSILEVIKK